MASEKKEGKKDDGTIPHANDKGATQLTALRAKNPNIIFMIARSKNLVKSTDAVTVPHALPGRTS